MVVFNVMRASTLSPAISVTPAGVVEFVGRPPTRSSAPRPSLRRAYSISARITQLGLPTLLILILLLILG